MVDATVRRRFSQFRRTALRELAFAARRRARPNVTSRTLQKAMRVDIFETSAFVRIPHYWAIYLHDGTKALLRAPTSRGKSVYVWFRRRRDDPRLAQGFPVRAKDARSLTREEYLKGLIENAKRRKQGRPPHMYVFKVVKASHPKPGARWFSNRHGMAGFPEEGSKLLLKRFGDLVKSLLPSDKQAVTIELG